MANCLIVHSRSSTHGGTQRLVKAPDRLPYMNLCTLLLLLWFSACAPVTPEDLYPDLTFTYVTAPELEAAGCAPVAYAQVSPERYTEITGSVVCLPSTTSACSYAVTLAPTAAGDIVLDPGVKTKAEVLNHELKHVLLGCTTGNYDPKHKSEVWHD